MRRTNAFEEGCLKGRGFIEFLVFQNTQGFAYHFAFIGIAAGVNEPLNKLAEGRWQGDGHDQRVSKGLDLSRNCPG